MGISWSENHINFAQKFKMLNAFSDFIVDTSIIGITLLIELFKVNSSNNHSEYKLLKNNINT